MDFSDATARVRVVEGRERGYVFVPAASLALVDGAARQLVAIQALMDRWFAGGEATVGYRAGHPARLARWWTPGR